MPRPTNTTVHRQARHWFAYAIELEHKITDMQQMAANDAAQATDLITSQERLLDLNIAMLRESEEQRHAQNRLTITFKNYIMATEKTKGNADIVEDLLERVNAAIEAYNEQNQKVEKATNES